MTSDDARAYDHLVKILLVGDSGVGKSSLLARFISDSFDEQGPTVGVDFKLKHVDVDGTRLKLTVWDTAGQERFRTLTSSYYRGAHGVVFVYDVTSRESFENARETWRKEVEMYGTIANSVKIVIGNKIDREDERTVARKEGVAFAKEYGCLFLECSAKTKVRGLRGTTYLDNLRARASAKDDEDAVEFSGEVDRIYTDAPSVLTIDDEALGRRFRVAKTSTFPDAVVWNPALTDKTRGMSDFGDEEYREMVCVEVAGVKDKITVEPGETWEASQTISYSAI